MSLYVGVRSLDDGLGPHEGDIFLVKLAARAGRYPAVKPWRTEHKDNKDLLHYTIIFI